MNKVKVMVGQTWVRNNNNSKIMVTTVNAGIGWEYVDGTGSGTIFDDRIHDLFTFVPANDLELLAIKMSEAVIFDHHSYAVIDGKIVGCTSPAKGNFTGKEIKGMRVHLGIEEAVIFKCMTDSPITLHDSGVEVCIDELSAPQAKKIFTQAMYDNEDKPLVDMRCIANTSESTRECVIQYLSHANAIYTVNGHECRSRVDEVSFLPIDTRTDQEKLVDEIAMTLKDMFYNNNDDQTFKSEAKVLIDKIISNEK